MGDDYELQYDGGNEVDSQTDASDVTGGETDNTAIPATSSSAAAVISNNSAMAVGALLGFLNIYIHVCQLF